MTNDTQNTAPFYIGQEVVALKTSKVRYGMQVKKGHHYHCAGYSYCSVCKTTYMHIKEFLNPPANLFPVMCHEYAPGLKYLTGNVKYFAPVSRLRISDKLTIAADLLQPQVEERADVQEIVNA